MNQLVEQDCGPNLTVPVVWDIVRDNDGAA